jgi:DNA-binding transcriptional MerR regulator
MEEVSLANRLKANPPTKQYRIGEVARYTGLSRQTVHNYTIMGLIRENEWTAGGHRLYAESVFETLAKIEQLKEARTLREIRLMFGGMEQDKKKSEDTQPAEWIRQPRTETLENKSSKN